MNEPFSVSAAAGYLLGSRWQAEIVGSAVCRRWDLEWVVLACHAVLYPHASPRRGCLEYVVSHGGTLQSLTQYSRPA
jgi:hypothetical protein